jgi:hypothetical protein
METAILAVIIIGFVAIGWLIRYEARRNVGILRAQPSNGEVLEHVENVQEVCTGIRDVLTEASKIKAAKEEKIARATVPPATPKGFVPIARRRAMAERVVSAPAEHRAQVVANNARAIEGA